MKKLLNILTSFSFVTTCGFSLIACDVKNDDNTNVRSEKNNLEKAKDFLSKGVTITDVLPGKTIGEYINHIKETNKEEIDSEINFILDDNYEEVRISGQQETNIVILLEDGEKNVPVQFKLKLSDKELIVNNILDQSKTKIAEISAIGLLAIDTIDEEVETRIIKLIEGKINNSDIIVEWSDESTLTKLVTEGENRGKVKLSVVENNEFLKSEIVDFSIVEVLDSEKAVNQKLVENAAFKIKEIDVAEENIEENVKLNNDNFKVTMNSLIKTIIDDSRIKVILNEEDATLRQKENKLSVKLSAGTDDNLTEKDDIIISLLNVSSGEKEKNKLILSELKQKLASIDGSSLNANLSLIDQKIWNVIKQKIQEILNANDFLKVTVTSPASIPNSTKNIQEVFNNIKGGKSRTNFVTKKPSNSGNKGGVNSASTGGTPSGNKGGVNSASTGGIPSGNKGGVNSASTGGTPSGNKGGVNSASTGGSNSANTDVKNSQNPNSTTFAESVTNFADKWSKTATLGSTNYTVTAFIKVGSGKNKVTDLITVYFKNVQTS